MVVEVEGASFTASQYDATIYIETSPCKQTILLLQDDDMILNGDDPSHI